MFLNLELTKKLLIICMLFSACQNEEENSNFNAEASYHTPIILSDDSSISGNFNLDTMKKYKEFASHHYKVVDGNLSIQLPWIKNLRKLNSLTQVKGRLSIEYCRSLINLEGLNNLQEVGGLLINRNCNLASLAGLENLVKIKGLGRKATNEQYHLEPLMGLRISNNLKLKSIKDLSSLTYIESGFFYSSLNGKQRLEKPEKLEYIGMGIDHYGSTKYYGDITIANLVFKFNEPEKHSGNVSDNTFSCGALMDWKELFLKNKYGFRVRVYLFNKEKKFVREDTFGAETNMLSPAKPFSQVFSAYCTPYLLDCNECKPSTYKLENKELAQKLAQKFAPVLKFDKKAYNYYYPTSLENIFDWSEPSSIVCGGKLTTRVKPRGNNTFLTYYGVQQHPTKNNRVFIDYWWVYIRQENCIGKAGGHDYDWEHIVVQADKTSNKVYSVTYFQHAGWYTRKWKSIETQGTHPVAYIGRIAHGMYYNSKRIGSDTSGQWSYFGDSREPGITINAKDSLREMSCDAWGFRFNGKFGDGQSPLYRGREYWNKPCCKGAETDLAEWLLKKEKEVAEKGFSTAKKGAKKVCKKILGKITKCNNFLLNANRPQNDNNETPLINSESGKAILDIVKSAGVEQGCLDCSYGPHIKIGDINN